MKTKKNNKLINVKKISGKTDKTKAWWSGGWLAGWPASDSASQLASQPPDLQKQKEELK